MKIHSNWHLKSAFLFCFLAGGDGAMVNTGIQNHKLMLSAFSGGDEKSGYNTI